MIASITAITTACTAPSRRRALGPLRQWSEDGLVPVRLGVRRSLSTWVVARARPRGNDATQTARGPATGHRHAARLAIRPPVPEQLGQALALAVVGDAEDGRGRRGGSPQGDYSRRREASRSRRGWTASASSTEATSRSYSAASAGRFALERAERPPPRRDRAVRGCGERIDHNCDRGTPRDPPACLTRSHGVHRLLISGYL